MMEFRLDEDTYIVMHTVISQIWSLPRLADNPRNQILHDVCWQIRFHRWLSAQV